MKRIQYSLFVCAALAAFAMSSSKAEAQCTSGFWSSWTDISPIVGDWDQFCESATGLYDAHVVAESPGFGGFRSATASRTNFCGGSTETQVFLRMQYERIDQDTGAITGSTSVGYMGDCYPGGFLRIHWNEAQNIWVRRARCQVAYGPSC